MTTRTLALLAGSVAVAVLVLLAVGPAPPQRKLSAGSADSLQPQRAPRTDAVLDAQRRSTAAAMRPGDSAAARAMDTQLSGSRELSAMSNGSSAVEPPTVAPDAAQSLADGLRNGDNRSPPIAPDAPAIERATPSELVDPSAYRRYEQRQQARLYRAFEQEAVIALNDLQRDLQRGRAAALPPEQLAEGEEKQRRLAETLERLRQGELGAQ